MRRCLLLPLLPALFGFTPFTTVSNVCPSCPKRKTDEVKLTSGLTLACKIVAQNDSYYVVTRFGELRAVMRNEIASIKWADESKGAQLSTGDQVLLKNGVVLHGSIVEQQPGRLLVIQVDSSRHIVWFGQIDKLHRNGQQQELGAAAAPARP